MVVVVVVHVGLDGGDEGGGEGTADEGRGGGIAEEGDEGGGWDGVVGAGVVGLKEGE